MHSVNWKSKNGEDIEIIAIKSIDTARVKASINGKIQDMDLPTILPDMGLTGDLAAVARIGDIILTQEQLDQVLVIMGALQAEIDADPEVRFLRLAIQRERLEADLGRIIDAAHNAFVDYLERVANNGYDSESSPEYAGKISAAQAVLAAFDAAHPEILCQLVANGKVARLAAQGQPVGEWIPVTDRMPHARRPVLAAYQTNSRGWVIIRAEWVAAGTKESSIDSEIGEYVESIGTYCDPEGWYEAIDNWDDYASVLVTEGVISHWTDLPQPPVGCETKQNQR